MYALTVGISLGASKAGLALKAALVDPAGNLLARDLAAGFVELGEGSYQWTYAAFPTAFSGSACFYAGTIGEDGDLADVAVLAAAAVNPADGAAADSSLVAVDHDTGGTDALRYLGPTGLPVAAGSAYLVAGARWDAGRRAPADAAGKTTTRADGRWAAPIPVPRGPYQAVFYKVGVLNPRSVRIDVA